MSKVWSWRHAVQQSDLPSMTKLVLFNLSVYMNGQGDSCFPSVEQQAKDTSLTKKSIITHLQKAVEAGFIRKKIHGYSGQGWARNEYEACYPEGGEPYTPRIEKQEEKGGERNTPRRGEGGVSDDQKAVYEVHPNSPIELSNKKNNTKKENSTAKKKITLQEWESQNQELTHKNLINFAEKHSLTEKQTQELVDRFRAKCEAHGYKYKNFSLAFQAWDWTGQINQLKQQNERGSSASRNKNIAELTPEQLYAEYH